MTPTNEQSGSSKLTELLTNLNKEGGFPISILTDAQGLPIASAAEEGMNPDRQSAVVAFIQKTATQVARQLGFSGSEEISLVDTDGRHLVCRSFRAHQYELILSVMVPERNTSYRRATSHTIKQIIELWTKYWE